METLRNFIKEDRENLLFEMVGCKEDYEGVLAYHALNLYNHLLYICSMGYIYPELIAHWCSEILTKFTPDVVTFQIKRGTENIDRGKCVECIMMYPLMGKDFEDYDVEDYVTAIKTEKFRAESDLSKERNSGRKALHQNRIRVCGDLLKNNNLLKYVEPNKNRLIEFYEKLKDAANDRNMETINIALNDFVKNSPGIE